MSRFLPLVFRPVSSSGTLPWRLCFDAALIDEKKRQDEGEKKSHGDPARDRGHRRRPNPEDLGLSCHDEGRTDTLASFFFRDGCTPRPAIKEPGILEFRISAGLLGHRVMSLHVLRPRTLPLCRSLVCSGASRTSPLSDPLYGLYKYYPLTISFHFSYKLKGYTR